MFCGTWPSTLDFKNQFTLFHERFFFSRIPFLPSNDPHHISGECMMRYISDLISSLKWATITMRVASRIRYWYQPTLRDLRDIRVSMWGMHKGLVVYWLVEWRVLTHLYGLRYLVRQSTVYLNCMGEHAKTSHISLFAYILYLPTSIKWITWSIMDSQIHWNSPQSAYIRTAYIYWTVSSKSPLWYFSSGQAKDN